MFSLQLLVLVLPALVLASSDDWLLSFLEKRDGVPIPLDDELSLDLRMVAKNTRPQLRKFFRSLNFACRQLNALESSKNERLKTLLDANNNFGNSLKSSCALYAGVRRRYLGRARRFAIGFSLVCRMHKAIGTSSDENVQLLKSVLSEHEDFNQSLHESCQQFRKVRTEMVKNIRLLRSGKNQPTPPVPTSTNAPPAPSPSPARRDVDTKRFLRDLFELL